MTEIVRQWFGNVRNYLFGTGAGTGPRSTDSRAALYPAAHEPQYPPRHSYFHLNNHLTQSHFNNNNNFTIFSSRKRKRSPDLDVQSMQRTKLSEKEEYKKLVEEMQNGWHSNGGGYASSKIPRINPGKLNGAGSSHIRVTAPPPLVLPSKTGTTGSAYFRSKPPTPSNLPLPSALVKSRQAHEEVKKVFESLDDSIEGVSELKAAHRSTVNNMGSSKFKAGLGTSSGFSYSSRPTGPLPSGSNPSQRITRTGNRQAPLYSTGLWTRSSGSGHAYFAKPEVITLTNDEDVEVISPIPKAFTSTPVQQRTPHFLRTANLRRGSNSSVTTGTSQSDSKRVSVESPEVVDLEKENETEDDPDIQVLSESIISPKNNQYQINSLELETRQSIYRQKTWLENSGSEYRESRRHREEQIDLERKKMEILKHESDLPNDIEERIRKQLMITDILILEPEEAVLTLPPITPEMKQIINHATTGRESEVIVTAFSIQITRGDLRTLAPCKWLNDNVINTYMELIAQRSKEGKFPKVHVFSTFFYPKYLKEGYSNILKRWTRKVDIFSMDLIIFPIHLGIHWCLAVADLRKKTIKFYDSLLGQQTRCLEALFSYLSSEMKERKKLTLNRSEWSMELMKDIPTQENGSDCGVFACKFAEYLSRDAKLTFKQKDMNYYRDRMVYEIVKQHLLYP